MYGHNRYKHSSHLRNMITKNEINSCIHLINRIKEHWHDKIKRRTIGKFKHLYFKKYGYHHNFTRGSEHLNNISQVTLSGHSQNLPSSSSSTTSNVSGYSITPAATITQAPKVTTSLASTAPTVAPSHTCTRPSQTCINSTNNTKQKWVINLSNTPLTSV